MRCKGFLFDLDGTLVDSLPAVERAWSNWARRHGLSPEEVLAFIHGKQAITSLRHFMAGKSGADIDRRVYAYWSTSRPRKPKVLPRFRGQSPYSII